MFLGCPGSTWSSWTVSTHTSAQEVLSLIECYLHHKKQSTDYNRLLLWSALYRRVRFFSKSVGNPTKRTLPFCFHVSYSIFLGGQEEHCSAHCVCRLFGLLNKVTTQKYLFFLNYHGKCFSEDMKNIQGVLFYVRILLLFD